MGEETFSISCSSFFRPFLSSFLCCDSSYKRMLILNNTPTFLETPLRSSKFSNEKFSRTWEESCSLIFTTFKVPKHLITDRTDSFSSVRASIRMWDPNTTGKFWYSSPICSLWLVALIKVPANPLNLRTRAPCASEGFRWIRGETSLSGIKERWGGATSSNSLQEYPVSSEAFMKPKVSIAPWRMSASWSSSGAPKESIPIFRGLREIMRVSFCSSWDWLEFSALK